MSTAAVSSTSIYQELQSYFQQRGSDQKALGQAIQSGDLQTAQQEYTAIQTLAQNGPFASGDAYKNSTREQDFNAIGQALQSGDLQGAQQAFSQLQSTFKPTQAPPVGIAEPPIIVNLGGLTPPSQTASPTATATSSAAPSSAIDTNPATTGSTTSSTGNGSEIVLNLGNITPGEQITIGVSNGSNGGEQVTIGVASQQGQAPEQFTLNLSQNQQVVLNLFNSLSGGGVPDGGVSVSA